MLCLLQSRKCIYSYPRGEREQILVEPIFHVFICSGCSNSSWVFYYTTFAICIMENSFVKFKNTSFLLSLHTNTLGLGTFCSWSPCSPSGTWSLIDNVVENFLQKRRKKRRVWSCFQNLGSHSELRSINEGRYNRTGIDFRVTQQLWLLFLWQLK